MTEDELLKFYGDRWTKLIQGSLRKNNRVATGKTLRSVKYTVNPTGFIVQGDKHIDNIINGRGKSRSSSGGGWLNELREWARSRNIPQGAVWAIYKSINAKGWSTPATPNLITSVINDQEVRNFTRDLGKIQLSLAKITIQKAINK